MKSKAYVIWLLTFWGKHIPLRLIKATRAYPIKLTHVYIPKFIYNVKDFTEYPYPKTNNHLRNCNQDFHCDVQTNINKVLLFL